MTARQIAIEADLSLPKIGAQFGGRDHTTVMHADRKTCALTAERRSRAGSGIDVITNRAPSRSLSAAHPRLRRKGDHVSEYRMH